MSDADPDSSALVGVSWLVDNLENSNLVILDASVPPVVPGFESVNSENDFSVIPGARRFDYDKEVCKPNSSLPHMMPTPELFQEKVRELGINNDSEIIVYDDVGLYASPRAWWMFRAMGHRNVRVLNGGLRAWKEAGQSVATNHAKAESPGNFSASSSEILFCDAPYVLDALEDEQSQILDARSAGRFNATAPEPRPGVRGGHMPSAKNLPFAEVLEEGRLRKVSELAKMFETLAGKDQTVITSCGSGITACVLTLAAWEAGYRNLIVYDGSWAEWGLPSKLPVVSD